MVYLCMIERLQQESRIVTPPFRAPAKRQNGDFMKQKNLLAWAAGILCTFCLMIIFLITSVESVVYWTPGYFEREYTMYHVPEAVSMEMDDLLYVTDEMMMYLRGEGRDNLNISVPVDGHTRPFFNEREMAHMGDVRNLFIGALHLRTACMMTAFLCLSIMFIMKTDVKRILPRAICTGTGIFFLMTAGLALLISTDFTKYFIIFHKIFFDNDLWILDPATDLLINIVPEPFFVDTAARIAFTFSFLVLALFFICLACIRRSGKRNRKAAGAALSLALFLALTVPSQTAYASEEWPEDVSIEADAGIVMDAASGTVLYGKNIHETYAPASITKVLTSVIVLEQCKLDEVVTFSKNAVYNVEADSSSAGYDTGDTATVKDCLYALLLKSANESANALAEHTAGSTEAFAELMNEKAKELGCVDSHFANPSGLNDENHYVSAYDMALITRYAFQNETFREIASTTYYELPPNARNPEGLGVSPGNKMVKKNFPEYRPDVIGGKTGYTSIALNTLVIGAKQDDTELITAVLHSSGTTYPDTSRLLDFGFQNFRSVPLAGNDTSWERLSSTLTIAGLPTSQAPALTVDPDSRIILPNNAEFDETVSRISFDLPENAPENAIAAIHYFLGEHEAGTAWLTLGTETQDSLAPIPEALLKVAPGTIAQISFENSEEDSEDSRNSSFPEPAAHQKEEDNGKETSKNIEKSHSEAPEPAKESRQADTQTEVLKKILPVLIPILLVLTAAACLGGIGLYLRRRKQQEETERQERRKKRLERLRESGVSEDEFNEILKNRRLSIPLEPDRRSPRKPKPSHRSSGSLLSGTGNAKRSHRNRDKGFSLKKRRWWKR